MDKEQSFMNKFLSSKQPKILDNSDFGSLSNKPQLSSEKSILPQKIFKKYTIPNEQKTHEEADRTREPIRPVKSIIGEKKSTDGMLKKFIAQLKRASGFKKIPEELNNKGFDLINDQSFFYKKFEKKNKIFAIEQDSNSLMCLQKKMKSFFKGSKFIIHPYQNFKIIWDLIQLFIMIFLFFYLPLDIIFDLENSLTIRNVLSPLMVVDNCLGLTTAYFHHGKLITSRIKIIKACRLDFILDMAVQFSLNYEIFSNNYNSSKIEDRFIKILIFVKYRKFLQIYQTFIDRFKIDMKFGFYLDFWHIIMTSICIMHWVACMWYFVGDYFGEPENWLIAMNLIGKTNFQKYVYSIYWCAVTMMTVGYGDIGPKNTIEMIFVIFVVVLGCGLSAYYIK